MSLHSRFAVLLLAPLAPGLLGCEPASAPPPLVQTHRLPGPAVESGRDKLILVVIDTLRPDHLGVAGYPRETSPTLDRLAGEGLYIPNLISQSSHTAPAVASLLSGLYPSQHGVQFWSSTLDFTGTGESGAPQLPEQLETLAERLAATGYQTAAVVSNPWLTPRHGYAQGFRHWAQLDCHHERHGFICDGERVSQLGLELLRRHRDDKLLLYLHYMDVHNPYAHAGTLPPRWRAAHGSDHYRNGPAPGLSAEDLAYMQALYDEGIRYVDDQLARLVAGVDQLGLSGSTLLVVTSDHGEEFLEHGGLGHGTSLHPELIGSFALLWAPGRIAPAKLRQRSALTDLMPTLLGWVGLPAPPELPGRDLLAAEPGTRPIVSELAREQAVLEGNWKYVWHLDAGSERLLRVDPAGVPVAHQPEPPADVRGRLRARLETLQRDRIEPLANELDEQTREQLEALGYLQ